MRIRWTLVFLGLILIFCLFPNHARAIPQKGLTLMPLRTEHDIAPGTSRQGKLTIDNLSSRDVAVSLSVEAFSVINQQYDYAFDSTTELSKWVNFSSTEVSLKSGESKYVQYTVSVPPTAEPGGRYISLFVSTDKELDSGGIESRQRIGSLLYITVLGDVTREGHLLGLSSPFFLGEASRFSMTIQNKGSTHFRSKYSITLSNIFTGREVATLSGDALILPGTIRSILEQVPSPRWPGIYKATYSVGLGDTPAATDVRFVLYAPLDFIVYLAAAIFLAGVFWFRSRKKRKLK